ncbi:hypothetical protein X798_08173, partial [Onchocerca flexuosa]
MIRNITIVPHASWIYRRVMHQHLTCYRLNFSFYRKMQSTSETMLRQLVAHS